MKQQNISKSQQIIRQEKKNVKKCRYYRRNVKEKNHRFFTNIIDGSFWPFFLLQIPGYYLVGGHFTKSQEGHWHFTKLFQISIENCAKSTEKRRFLINISNLLEKCTKSIEKTTLFQNIKLGQHIKNCSALCFMGTFFISNSTGKIN